MSRTPAWPKEEVAAIDPCEGLFGWGTVFFMGDTEIAVISPTIQGLIQAHERLAIKTMFDETACVAIAVIPKAAVQEEL